MSIIKNFFSNLGAKRVVKITIFIVVALQFIFLKLGWDSKDADYLTHWGPIFNGVLIALIYILAQKKDGEAKKEFGSLLTTVGLIAGATGILAMFVNLGMQKSFQALATPASLMPVLLPLGEGLLASAVTSMLATYIATDVTLSATSVGGGAGGGGGVGGGGFPGGGALGINTGAISIINDELEKLADSLKNINSDVANTQTTFADLNKSVVQTNDFIKNLGNVLETYEGFFNPGGTP